MRTDFDDGRAGRLTWWIGVLGLKGEVDVLHFPLLDPLSKIEPQWFTYFLLTGDERLMTICRDQISSLVDHRKEPYLAYLLWTLLTSSGRVCHGTNQHCKDQMFAFKDAVMILLGVRTVDVP